MSSLSFPQKALRGASVLWFTVAAVGQMVFIGFILAFYGVRTATGNFAGWNDKPLIDGYIQGDNLGNVVFAAHVLLASVVTLCGLMQLVPALRRKWPRLHRWSGRTFMVIALFMALSGVWLAVVRGTYLSVISAVAILINAVLILVFVALAWRHAIKRRFEQHRRWAMRTFMAVSGVWFLRVGIMGWIVINRGPVGMTDKMSGPTDIVLTFGSYLIPLAVLELYEAAQRSDSNGLKSLTATVLALAAAFTAIGVFGAIAFLWGPYL
ncbi:DUF2306 domain-containing protein [Caulobacter sp.]|uniref:DUF2306 domain-containing protein n=1 Tax=Caulobacter sp. TaxID=78 RepID=UPI001B154F98|nr:DUF2306 domain-containing protein [Caulobacter sp.]MBO9544394.1 DUF2306 domain-containing protein [Caulobacter sp.]